MKLTLLSTISLGAFAVFATFTTCVVPNSASGQSLLLENYVEDGAVEESPLEKVSKFYQTEDLSLVPEALSALVEVREREHQGATGLFNDLDRLMFVRIAQEHPSVIDGIVELLPDASHETRVFIIEILQKTGDPSVVQTFKKLSEDERFKEEKELIEMVLSEGARPPPDAMSIELKTGEDLDRLWAEFLVTGNTEAVERIVGVLRQPDLARTEFEDWLAHGAAFSLLGIGKHLKQRKLESLNSKLQATYTAMARPWSATGISVDFEKKSVTTPEDLDLILMMAQLFIRPQEEMQQVFSNLPFDVSGPQYQAMLLKALAKWSLASNAKQHPLVLRTCEKALAEASVREELALLHIVVDAYIDEQPDRALPFIDRYLELSPDNLEMQDNRSLAQTTAEGEHLRSLLEQVNWDRVSERGAYSSEKPLVNGSLAPTTRSDYVTVARIKDLSLDQDEVGDQVIVSWLANIETNRMWVRQKTVLENFPNGAIDQWSSSNGAHTEYIGAIAIAASSGREEIDALLSVGKLNSLLSNSECAPYHEALGDGQQHVVCRLQLQPHDQFGPWQVQSFVERLTKELTHAVGQLDGNEVGLWLLPISSSDEKVSVMRYLGDPIVQSSAQATVHLLVDAAYQKIEAMRMDLNAVRESGTAVQIQFEQAFGANQPL